MSKYLFRGRLVQRVRRFPEEYHDFGWKYGDLHHYYNGSYFTHITEIDADKMETNTWDVVSHSVGQCTGLKDKNGNWIFEGDILQYTEHKGYCLPSFLAYVVWMDNCACFGYSKADSEVSAVIPFNRHDELYEDFLNYCQIVGNDYDNKDLLAIPSNVPAKVLKVEDDKDLPF